MRSGIGARHALLLTLSCAAGCVDAISYLRLGNVFTANMTGHAVLLGIAMPLITFIARRLRFNREDEIAIVFCGSKKSLATGVPIAKVLFAGGSLGAIVLPVMIYHQIQLIVCGVIAQRYARRKP